MISTVTTTTTTTTTTASIAVVAALGAVAVILLVAFLTTRELAVASDRPLFKALGRNVTVAILPLLMVFGMTVCTKVMEIVL